jgi:peptidoglycan/LPS O-acetylase OafA/YrhL
MIASLPGVPVFFVISGFLVTHSFVRHDGGVLGYFMRRALRIYPASCVHFILIMVMLWAGGALPIGDLATAAFWAWIGTALVTCNDFWANIVAGNVFNYEGFYKWFPSGVLWTMAAEIGFYIIVPVIFCSLFQRNNWIPIAITVGIIVSIMFSTVLTDWQRDFPTYNTTGELFNSPLPFLWLFLIGSSVSYWWDKLGQFFVGKAVYWAVFYGVLYTAERYLFAMPPVDPVLVNPMTFVNLTILGGLVISCAFTAPILASVLRGNDISYGLYLYHMPVIATLSYAGLAGQWWLWLVAYLAPFSLALGSWLLIERPALRLKARFAYASPHFSAPGYAPVGASESRPGGSGL